MAKQTLEHRNENECTMQLEELTCNLAKVIAFISAVSLSPPLFSAGVLFQLNNDKPCQSNLWDKFMGKKLTRSQALYIVTYSLGITHH